MTFATEWERIPSNIKMITALQLGYSSKSIMNGNAKAIENVFDKKFQNVTRNPLPLCWDLISSLISNIQ